jgi:proline dehydrogenase
MLRKVILAAAGSSRVERLVENAPVSRNVVRRFVAGTTSDDALRCARELVTAGLGVSLDHLGEDTTNPAQAEATAGEYLRLLDALQAAELTPAAEVSLKLSAVGQLFDDKQAYQHARAICARASEAGTTVTLDMEDHATTDSTLEILHKLRVDFPTVGVAIQAYLRRAEADCRELAVEGMRVRLCKGAYREPESVAFQTRLEVDKSYVRCLNALMSGPGYPMVATHDPRLIAIGEDRAKWFDRSPDEFEFQLLFGVRPEEQLRLAELGYTVRVYVPYGTQWYGYLMRRMGERPANVAFFLRALRSRN